MIDTATQGATSHSSRRVMRGASILTGYALPDLR